MYNILRVCIQKMGLIADFVDDVLGFREIFILFLKSKNIYQETGGNLFYFQFNLKRKI